MLPFFRKYDLQKRKCLDISELSTLFKDLGEKVPQKELEKYFADYDKNGNGFIDFDEFVLGTLEFLQSNREILQDDSSMMPGDVEARGQVASDNDDVSSVHVFVCVFKGG